MKHAQAIVLGLLTLASPRVARSGDLGAAKIEQLTGAKGAPDATEGVFKVSVPRSDLAVTVAGVKMVPALGLTSWAAFTRAGDSTMVMGDLVLQEDQVVPVMDAALNSGLEVTALHNHFLADSPKIMFMHIGGIGERDALATAVGNIHNHMTLEEPRVVFLHFWGIGPLRSLAAGIKSALDAQAAAYANLALI